MTVPPDLIDRYTSAALSGARSHAAAIAAEVLACAGEHAPAVHLVDELLAPAQVQVGERWLDRRCSVGDEHAATFVTESVLSSLTVGFEPEPHRGTFVMTCAEGERHDLPARMAAELLIVDGWNVVHLGSPTSATELSTYLAGIDADAVGVSATVATSLPGAARSVAVARRLGCTVVVGGAAFGRDPRRARAVGAHGWVADLRSGLVLDEVCWDDPVDAAPHTDWSTFETRRDDVVSDTVGWIAVNHDTDLLRSTSWLDAAVHEIETAVDIVTAALVIDDPTVVAEHRAWLARIEAVGGSGALGVGVYEALAGILHQHSVPALRTVESALAGDTAR